MRLYRVLTGVSIAVILVGLGFTPAAVGPRNVRVNWILPSGTRYIAEWQSEVLSGGSVSGSFHVETPDSVAFYVFTQVEHDQLLAGYSPDSLASLTGFAGNFSVQLPSAGTYFLVVTHCCGSTSNAEGGTVALSISAVSTWPTLEAAAGILIGIGLMVAARLSLRRYRRRPAPAAPLGVTAYCPNCGTFRAIGERVCGTCGHPFFEPPKPETAPTQEPPRNPG